MKRLLVATTNQHKLREIRSLLGDAPVMLIGLDSLPPIREPEETGATFEDNARLKALYYDRAVRSLCRNAIALPATSAGATPCAVELTVAEDSGLAIDALNGEPGIHSARFLRPDATYAERFAEIFRRLDSPPGRARTARFVCSLAVVEDGVMMFETTGTVEGEIAREPRGSAGFGYDPIFYFPPYGCTLAEVTDAEKLQVAHRGQAFRALARWLGG